MVRCPGCGRRFVGETALCGGTFHRTPASPAVTRPGVDPVPDGYDLERVLGSGGFATVVSARRRADGSRVALKLAHAGTHGTAERLRREAVALRRIGAPWVPTLLDEGTLPDGSPWLALELLDGPTLAERLARTAPPVPIEEAVAIGVGLARALAAIHAHGLVHRDVKPENVFALAERVVVVDLGLVTGGAVVPGVTRAGAAPGTPEYMAPEQCDGTAVDARADLYALGVILYELVTGRPPFFGTAADVIDAHLRRRPPRPSDVAALSRALEALILTLLAKSPADRPADATDVAERLVRLTGSSIAASHPTPATVVAGPRAPVEEPEQWVGLAFVDAPSASVLHARAATLGARIAYAKDDRTVLVFEDDGDATPVRRAFAAAQRLLAAGAATRIAVDLGPVRYRSRAGEAAAPRSAAFFDPARYPTDGDGARLIVSEVAASALAPASAVAVSGRPGYVEVHDALVSPRFTLAGAEPGTLVGRDGIVDEIVGHAVRAATATVPTITTLIAEAGMGKSHLFAALYPRLRDLERAELVGLRAREPLGDEPHLLVAELVTWILGLPDTAAPETARAALRERLGTSAAQLEPPLALALGWLAPESGEVAHLVPAPGAIQALAAQAVAELLRSRARGGPLWILVDDAQWADAVALAALQQATLEEASAPIWVGIFARPAFELAYRGWGTLAARHVRVTLGPLDPDAADRLLRRLLHPADRVPADAVASLLDQTQRTPLLMVELAKRLRADGVVRKQPGTDHWYLATDELARLPPTPTVTWLAQRELGALSADLQSHARLASLLSAELEESELAGVLRELETQGMGGDFPLAARAGLDLLTKAGLLVERRSERFAFRHALIREAVAATVSTDQRRLLHRAAAAHYRRAAHRRPAWRMRWAHHAAEAGLAEQAAELFLDQGERARGRHAYLEAEGLYSRALENLAADDAARRLDAYRGRGIMRHRTGRYADATADFEAARGLARVLGQSRLEAEILLDEAEALDWMQDFQRAAARAGEAEALIGASSDPLLRARLRTATARSLSRTGQGREADPILAEVVASLDRLGDEAYETRVIALLLRISPLADMRRFDESERIAAQVIELTQARSDRLHLGVAYMNRAILRVMMGDVPAGIEDALAHRRLTRDLGSTTGEIFIEAALAELNYLAGRIDEAVAHGRRNIELVRTLHGRLIRGEGLLLLGRALLWRGDLEGARHARDDLVRAEAEAVAAGGADSFLTPPERVLLRMLELGTRDATDAEWDAVEADARGLAFQYDPVEVAEQRGLWQLRQGRAVQARHKLEEAHAMASSSARAVLARLERDLDRASEHDPQ